MHGDCTRDAHGLPVGCSWAASGMLTDAREMPVGCPWTARETHKVYARGIPVGCPWDTRGPSVGYLWAVFGLSMGNLRDARGMPASCPWAARRLILGSP